MESEAQTKKAHVESDVEDKNFSYRIAKIKMGVNGLNTNDPVYHEELIRLMLQSLHKLGLKKSAKTLQAESGISLETPIVRDLRALIRKGTWDKVVELAAKIHVGTSASLRQYLEILESKNLLHALQCLRENISPLQVHQSRVKLLSSLLMCQSLAEIREKATWEGATGGSRAALLKKLQVFFPPAHMIQDDRLDTLIRQAVDHQEEQCLFHNYEDAYVTLYEDHVCPRKEFPLQCVCVLKQHSDEVWFVKFSNDGSRLASASKDKTVILWDVATMQASHVLKKHSDSLWFVAWSPDDAYILTCSNDKNIRMWDTSDATCVLTVTKHDGSVQACAWLPDGQGFVSAGLEQKTYLWSIEGKLMRTWSGVRINDMAVTHDGEYLVAICYEKKIRIYNLKGDGERFIQESFSIMSIALSADSRYALVSLQSQHIHLWDLHEAKLVKKFSGPTQGRFVIRSCFGGHNDSFVLSGSEDYNVYIWHRHSGCLLNILKGHTGTVNSVSWNPNNNGTLASASDDGTILIWGAKPLDQPAGNNSSSSNVC